MPTPRKSHAEICEAAAELDSREAKVAYIAEACGDDVELRRRVEEHVFGPEPKDGFMRPAVAVLDSEKPGDRIGNYKLLQQIGEGGCGLVFMAEQEKPIQRRVALKVIKLGMDTKSVIARFEAERQALAMMEHPHIARVLDAGATERGRPFFVMELVRGLPITEFCDQRALSTEQRLDLLIKVCHAVQHAHQKGIIHRDLKPSNILVPVNDGEPVPKVIDFGIAKATAGQMLTDKTVFTAFEQFIGTPDYMSPEQAEMTSLDIDTRSDIYSLGVLLYELLTGKTPLNIKELRKEGIDEMRRAIREKDPVRPSTRLRGMPEPEQTTTAKQRQATTPWLINRLSGDLDWIVMKCLEKDRERRYKTANELAEDLQRFLRDEAITARPPSQIYRLRKLVRRKPALAVALAAIVVAAVAVGGSLIWRHEAKLGKERAGLAEQMAQLAAEKARLADEKSELAAEKARRADERAGRRQLVASNDFLVRFRPVGWSTLVSNNVAVAGLPCDHEILTEMARAFAGPDARRIYDYPLRPSTAAAAAPDGRFVVASDGRTNAFLIETNGELVELPVGSVGPVGWPSNGVPLQAVARSNAVELREMTTRNVRQRFRLLDGERVLRPDGKLPALAMTPDGGRIAAVLVSSNGGNRVYRTVVWDSATGEPLGEVPDGATVLAFSPDGSLLAGGKPRLTEVYSVPGLSRFRTPSAGTRRSTVLALAFARDRLVRDEDTGETNRLVLAVADDAGKIVVWDVNGDVNEEKPRSYCLGSLDKVLALAWHPDGITLASAGRNNANLWDAMTGTRLLTLTGQGADSARALAFTPDGTRLIWGVHGAQQSSIGIWQIEASGRGIQVCRGLSPNPRVVWFSPDSSRVAALANDWLLGIWNVSGQLLWLIEAPSGWSADNAGGAFDPAGRLFAFAANTQGRLYDLDSGRIVHRWNLARGLCDSLQYDDQSRLLLLRREYGSGQRWPGWWRLYELRVDAAEPVLVHEQKDPSWGSYLTVLAPGARHFIVANGGVGPRKVVKVFDTQSGEELRSFETQLDTLDTTILPDPTGQRFAFLAGPSNSNCVIRLSDLTPAGGSPSATIGPFPGQYAQGAGQGVIACGTNFHSCGAMLGIDWQAIYYAYYSPDGRKLGWGAAGGAVLVGNLEEVQRRLEAFARAAR
jgi:serine/threonine protein kinase/WD40 repeat protein